MFEKLKGIVLNLLGRESLEHDQSGKLVLTDDDRTKLAGAFGEQFPDKFMEAMDKELSDKQAVEKANEAVKAVRAESEQKMRDMAAKHEEDVKALGSQLNAEKAAKEKAEAEVANLNAKVSVLSLMPEQDKAEEVMETQKDAIVSEPWHGKKANRKYFHNQMAFNKQNGDASDAILAQATNTFSFGGIRAGKGTIDTSDLAEEFGDYMSQFNIKLEIVKLLTQPTESQKYMTTKMAIKSWKASKSAITSVVQQFVAKWTPLGASEFTPIEIVNRRHKVNLPITPDDITDGWLMYLYNEQVTPDKMPVTRYIIEELLRPRIADDIELKLIATGVYEELGSVTQGQAGQATGKSMDGYLTILKAIYADEDNNANFYEQPTDAEWYDDGKITQENVLAVLEDYGKWVKKTAPLYHAKGMDVLIDPEIHDMYLYAYRDAFPMTKNEDGTRSKLDFTKLNFVALEAMRGSGMFFCTPKENFVRLIHQNEANGSTNIFLQVENYDVKVFAEFWLACGFALEELIFAYVPETEEGSV